MKARWNDRPIYIGWKKIDVHYEDDLEPQELSTEEVDEIFEFFADEISEDKASFAGMDRYDSSKGD